MSSVAATDTPGPLGRVLEDARVSVAEMDPRLADPDQGLFAEEARAVEKAVLSRRQQFAAGRQLARRAWQRLGHAPVALLSDAQRVPAWPSGLVGTITHTSVWCAAAVARAGEVQGLGADVELATPLERNLWERVCRPEERSWLEALPGERAGLLGKAIFSAKESIYKALYPRLRVFLDFQGMRIELEPETAAAGTAQEPVEASAWRWQPTLMSAWGPYAPGHRFAAGRLRIDGELICSAVVL